MIDIEKRETSESILHHVAFGIGIPSVDHRSYVFGHDGGSEYTREEFDHLSDVVAEANHLLSRVAQGIPLVLAERVKGAEYFLCPNPGLNGELEGTEFYARMLTHCSTVLNPVRLLLVDFPQDYLALETTGLMLESRIQNEHGNTLDKMGFMQLYSIVTEVKKGEFAFDLKAAISDPLFAEHAFDKVCQVYNRAKEGGARPVYDHMLIPEFT